MTVKDFINRSRSTGVSVNGSAKKHATKHRSDKNSVQNNVKRSSEEHVEEIQSSTIKRSENNRPYGEQSLNRSNLELHISDSIPQGLLPAVTLDEIDRRLSFAGDYRQHFSEDNGYDSGDSSSSSPTIPRKGELETLRLGTDISQPESPSSSIADTPTERRDDVAITAAAAATVAVEKKAARTARRHRFKDIRIIHQDSILDKESSKSSTFFGFYTLFWLTMGVFCANCGMTNFLAGRPILGPNIPNILIRDLVKVALTDSSMYLSTYFVVGLQLAIKKGYITWDRSGWLIQTLWQGAFLFFFMWWSNYLDYPWIGRVFLLLHSLVLLMKQHSYGFYNGYLWNITNELSLAEMTYSKVKDSVDSETRGNLEDEIDFCRIELAIQSKSLLFPANITVRNYFMYSMFPTLVYQIDYPRTKKIRWGYVFEKIAAVFGVFFLMIILAEHFLYPIAMRALELREVSIYDRLRAYPALFCDLLLPFVPMYLLVFYIIWDAILNAVAELTMFGDREFYGEWWNSVTWDQFARDWNVPVHRFLLRHVYHSSMAAFKVSKSQATLFTFLLSSCVHELVMFSIFRRLRGYLLFLQMCQLPLVALSRTRFMRKKHLLGNVIFWLGIITGPSMLCSLYLTF